MNDPSATDADSLKRAEKIAEHLYPHQVDGIAFLLGRRRAILADDMGLGKTRQSIIAMELAAPAGPWCVICPASVKRNWEREVREVSFLEEPEIVVVDRQDQGAARRRNLTHEGPVRDIGNRYRLRRRHI